MAVLTWFELMWRVYIGIILTSFFFKRVSKAIAKFSFSESCRARSESSRKYVLLTRITFGSEILQYHIFGVVMKESLVSDTFCRVAGEGNARWLWPRHRWWSWYHGCCGFPWPPLCCCGTQAIAKRKVKYWQKNKSLIWPNVPLARGQECTKHVNQSKYPLNNHQA